MTKPRASGATNKKLRKRQPNPKQKNTKKNVKKTKKNLPCDKCNKSFSNAFNLKNHKQVKHGGLVWICPFCQKTQVSKYSHERHIKKCPDVDTKDEINPDCNSVYLTSKIEYTPKAASSLIERLTQNNLHRAKLIVDLKKRLLLSLKQNVALKNALQIDHEDEDKEIESLIEIVEVDTEGVEEKEGEECEEDCEESEEEKLSTADDDNNSDDDDEDNDDD